MYSELLRIPINLNGVPLFGFGILLALWLALSAWGLAVTARQSGWGASLRAHLPTILIIAAAIAWLVPKYFPDGVPIRGYGVMVLAGSVAGILMALHRARQARLAPDEIVGLAVALFLCGIVGARLFFVIEYWDTIRQPDWLSTLKQVLSVTEGGLVVYGAFIGAMLGFTWYVKRRGLPALAMSDLIAPSMVIGLAFGRIGCLLNGCCYGGETDVPWAVTFPRDRSAEQFSAPYADQAAAGRFHGMRISQRPAPGHSSGRSLVVTQVDRGSPAERAGVAVGDKVAAVNGKTVDNLQGVHELLITALAHRQDVELRTPSGEVRRISAVEPPPRCLPVHPTQVYSSVNAALLAWVLWSYYPFRRREGEVTTLMITLYPIARFFEEAIRVDEPSVFGTGLSISQNISLVLLAVAAGMWRRLRKKPAGRLDFPLTSPAA